MAALLLDALEHHKKTLKRLGFPLPFEFGELHQETTPEIAADGAVRFHAHINGEQFCFTVHRCAIKPQEQARTVTSRVVLLQGGADVRE